MSSGSPKSTINGSIKSSRKKLKKEQKKQQLPPPSPPNPSELRKMDQQISITKNRVSLLQQQLQREKDGIRKNKSLTKQVIAKKISVNQVNMMKKIDPTEQALRLERLRQKNRSMRLEHKKSLEDIQQAIYLVKLDDARELRNISLQHKKKIQQISEQSMSAANKRDSERHKKSKVKARYMQYSKIKEITVSQKKQLSVEDLSRSKDEKSRKLKQLEEQEKKLKSQIQKYHSKNVSAKKQYVTALSLPMKDLAQALEKGQTTLNNIPITDRSSLKSRSVMDMPSQISNKKKRIPSSIGKKRYEEKNESINFGPKVKIPNTNVNMQKFSIILTELKRIDLRKKKAEEQARKKAEEEEQKQKKKWKRK